MDKKDVRIPQQKRSIEKKQKIIAAATQIFMEHGYFNGLFVVNLIEKNKNTYKLRNSG